MNKTKKRLQISLLALGAALLMLAPILSHLNRGAQAFSQPFVATDAIGQNVGSDPTAAVDYFQWHANNGSGPISSGGLDSPVSLALDAANHRLFVADTNNCRVLVYNLSVSNQLLDRVADNVLGTTTFDNTDPNWCGTGATAMNTPTGVVYDAIHNRLFVSDEYADVVHIYDLSGGITNGMAETNVLGAPDVNSPGWGSLNDAKSFSQSEQMAYDPTNDRLFLTDGWYDHRILVFDFAGGISDGMDASYVLGEPDFTTTSFTADASGMNRPYGLAYDDVHKRLFEADILTNRVTVFDLSSGISNGMASSYVLGQPDFFTYSTGLSATKMNSPRALTYDASQDRLLVSEQYNNRVTVFDLAGGISNGMAANSVLGQPDFTSGSCSTSQGSVCWPMQTAFDAASGTLWLADQSNSRVMIYGAVPPQFKPVDGLGQTGGNPNGPMDFTTSGTATTDTGLSNPHGTALDPVHHRLFVADSTNCRVLVYGLSATNAINSYAAVHVLGEPDMTSAGCGGTQSQMIFPIDVTYDSANDQLFVGDDGRVLVYDLSGGISDGMNAAHVIGQPNFTTNTCAFTQAEICNPQYLTFDPISKTLFLAEGGNRVLIYDLSGGISDGMNATHVLGQPDFTSTNSGTDHSHLNNVFGVAYDQVGKRLFVGDFTNVRIMVYDLSGGISDGMNASGVIAQPDFSYWDCELSQEGICDPQGMAFDQANKRLFLVDDAYNRVTQYNFVNLQASVPDGATGSSYSQSIGQQVGGTPSYTIASGSLPSGMVLGASTGDLTGTPTAAGTYNFAVRVNDNVGKAGTYTSLQNYALVVSGAGGPSGGGPSGGSGGADTSGGSSSGNNSSLPAQGSTSTTSSSPQPTTNTSGAENPIGTASKPVPTAASTEPSKNQGFFLLTALRNFIRSIPESVARAFPWLLFVLLGLIALWSLQRTIAEARVVKRLAALVQKQQLLAEEKDTFVELSSHYLRTPLTIVAGGAELAGSLPGGKPLADALQAPIAALKTASENILAAIKNNQGLQHISPVTADHAKPNVLKLPQFWVPMMLVGVASGSADYLFAIWQNLNTSTIAYLEQSLAYVLAGLLLYGTLRRFHTSRLQRARTEQLLDEQIQLDSARNEFIDKVADDLGGQVTALQSVINANSVNGSKASEHVQKGVSDLKATVGRFRLLALLKAGQLGIAQHPLDVTTLVAAAEASVATSAEAKQVKLSPLTESTQIVGDPQLLQTVVSSVVDNAVKYSAEGGQVTSRLQRNSGGMELAIHNDGSAIPEDKLAHLFQPFARAEGSALDFSQQGMGFSLYLDKIVMDYLGGSISAESHENKGTTVAIQLPV